MQMYKRTLEGTGNSRVIEQEVLFRYIPSRVLMQRIVLRVAYLSPDEYFGNFGKALGKRD